MAWFDEVPFWMSALFYFENSNVGILQVFRFGWKSRDTDPFMFRMNLGHFTQVGFKLDSFSASLRKSQTFKSKWVGETD